jgi:hypothetical protein
MMNMAEYFQARKSEIDAQLQSIEAGRAMAMTTGARPRTFAASIPIDNKSRLHFRGRRLWR